jgi:hypothetical protein
MNLVSGLIVIGAVVLLGLLFFFAPSMTDNATAFNLMFSGVVAIATVVYALLTSKLVLETRSLREAQTEPRVEVFMRITDVWIRGVDIVVKNIGAGPAYDVLKFRQLILKTRQRPFCWTN